MYATFFDRFLVERQYITETQRIKALRVQEETNVRIGTLAFHMGYLNEEQLGLVHDAQRPRDRMFGELAMEMGMITPEQLGELLEKKQIYQTRFTDVLINHDFMEPHDVARSWMRWKRLQEWREHSNRVVLHHLEHPELAEGALEVSRKCLMRFADIESELAIISHDIDDLHSESWLIAVPVKGALEGRIIFSCGDDVLLAIASSMLGRAWNRLDLVATEQLKEFARLVGHQLSLRPGIEGHLHLGTPEICQQGTGKGSLLKDPPNEATTLRLDLKLPDHRIETLHIGLLEDCRTYNTTFERIAFRKSAFRASCRAA